MCAFLSASSCPFGAGIKRSGTPGKHPTCVDPDELSSDWGGREALQTALRNLRKGEFALQLLLPEVMVPSMWLSDCRKILDQARATKTYSIKKA